LALGEESLRRIPPCPPEMRQIADRFNEMGRLWGNNTFEDTDDTGELQLVKRGKTVCEAKNELNLIILKFIINI
jgi:hypothetical protein